MRATLLIISDQSRLWYSPYHSPPEFSPDPCIDHAIGRAPLLSIVNAFGSENGAHMSLKPKSITVKRWCFLNELLMTSPM